MIEGLKKSLRQFDEDTVEYLETNKNSIFESVAVNTGMPEEIGLTLGRRFVKRQILVDAIEKLEKTEK